MWLLIGKIMWTYLDILVRIYMYIVPNLFSVLTNSLIETLYQN